MSTTDSDQPAAKHPFDPAKKRTRLRVAVLIDHPIQHFAPWHAAIARDGRVDIRVLFFTRKGIESHENKEFGSLVKWDIPLVSGYVHEFLPIAEGMTARLLLPPDNPSVVDSLDRFNPDVVKVFGYASRTCWRAAAWAKRNSVPVLLYSDSNVRHRHPLHSRAARDLVARRFYRMVDGAMYVGNRNREYHSKYGIPDYRLFRGMLPIDYERFLASAPSIADARRTIRQRYGIPQNAFVVALLGKYIPRKRPEDLIRAVAGPQLKNLGVWAMLIGEGPSRPQLTSLMTGLGVANARLTGFVNQSQIPTHLAACDVLAVTSSYDPHPLAVTEGATFGLPIVASDSIGCVGETDTARPGRNALVYRTGSIAELSAAIARLVDDRKLYDSMAIESSQIAESQGLAAATDAFVDAIIAVHELGPRAVRGRPRIA